MGKASQQANQTIVFPSPPLPSPPAPGPAPPRVRPFCRLSSQQLACGAVGQVTGRCGGPLVPAGGGDAVLHGGERAGSQRPQPHATVLSARGM